MRLWIPVLASLFVTGCLIVPTASYKMSEESRRPIPDDRLRSLQGDDITRADVLLTLGAPEALLDGERLILYQWSTQVGAYLFMGVDGSLDSEHHDQLYEFDQTGRLVRSGDLKTLLMEGLGRGLPLDLAQPIEIAISHGLHPTRGRMILRSDAAELRLQKPDKTPQSFTVLPGDFIAFDYQTMTEARPEWRRYDLRFRDSTGEVRVLDLRFRSASLYTVARYLHQHSPAIEITD